MFHRQSIGAIALKAGPVVALLWAVLAIAADNAVAGEDAKYPDWKGQWRGILKVGTFPGQPSFDPTKPQGKGQQAPLTPEYQEVLEANLKIQSEGGAGDWGGVSCRGFGMPIITYGVQPIEFIVTPESTYILIDFVEHTRRVYTDGREWPKEIEPTYAGYSLGKWIDMDNDGRYDVLEVETRGFKGPRQYDVAGLPLHYDNQSVFKERIYLDKNDKNVIRNEITVFDHALTRPWTVTRSYVRNPNPRADWAEFICGENNLWTRIGNEDYFLSGDGFLMPIKKDQPPPDLRYFKQPRK